MRKTRLVATLIGIVLVIVGVSVRVKALQFNSDPPKVVIENNYGNIDLGDVLQPVGESFGSAGDNPSRLPNGYWDTGYGYAVDGTKVIDGYGIVAAGPLSGSLTLSGAVTTTPGSLFSIANPGEALICDRVEVDITTGITDSYNFKVATSTLATSWSANGHGLIATTTVATSTKRTLNNVDNGGNSEDSWVWDTTEYINGAFDSDGAADNASSSPRSVAAGKYYIRCHAR